MSERTEVEECMGVLYPIPDLRYRAVVNGEDGVRMSSAV